MFPLESGTVCYDLRLEMLVRSYSCHVYILHSLYVTLLTRFFSCVTHQGYHDCFLTKKLHLSMWAQHAPWTTTDPILEQNETPWSLCMQQVLSIVKWEAYIGPGGRVGPNVWINVWMVFEATCRAQCHLLNQYSSILLYAPAGAEKGVQTSPE